MRREGGPLRQDRGSTQLRGWGWCAGPNKAPGLCVSKGIGLPRLLNTEERLRTQKSRMKRCEWEPCVPDHIRVLKLGDGLSSEWKCLERRMRRQPLLIAFCCSYWRARDEPRLGSISKQGLNQSRWSTTLLFTLLLNEQQRWIWFGL